jgi:hypothetical protein
MSSNLALGNPIQSILAYYIYLTTSGRKKLEGTFCGMVMLDLQKALDTVDHEILFNQTKSHGL